MMGGNKHKFSSNEGSDGSEPPRVPHYDVPFPPPLWRFRSPLSTGSMVRAIKSQIIPRIALAFRSATTLTPSNSGATAWDVAPFIDMLLSGDDRAADVYVERLQGNGILISAIFLELFAPTARRLGEMWEKDATDFASVTLAVSRLQRMMRHLIETAPLPAVHVSGASAMLTAVPDDQHCFGLYMAAEFFRREGWSLCIGPFATREEFVALLRERWFDIVGFSVSSDRRLGDLASEVQIVRRQSRNRKVGIILGGPLVCERPELAASVGADMVSVDVTIAPRHAHALVEVMKGRN
jgi:MerR family transcriptional regulator, light-induced transcriptional regulator